MYQCFQDEVKFKCYALLLLFIYFLAGAAAALAGLAGLGGTFSSFLASLALGEAFFFLYSSISFL
jgi:hypothetical protein